MLALYVSMLDSQEEKRKFEKIYLSHRQTMYYAAYSILQDVHEAEDVVHQAFLRMINLLDKVGEPEEAKTRAYVVTVAESIAIDTFRRRRRIVPLDEEKVDIAPVPDCGYEERDAIQRAIHRLPVQYGTVLNLRYSHGLEDEEIAGLLKISEANVRQRISRARKKLALLLEQEGIQV